MKEREELTPIISAAVEDAYRIGFGQAVQAVERYATQSLHPAHFHDLLRRLRQVLVEFAKDVK